MRVLYGHPAVEVAAKVGERVIEDRKLCRHHWLIESSVQPRGDSGYYFPAHCKLCGLKALFKGIWTEEEDRALYFSRPRKPTSREYIVR